MIDRVFERSFPLINFIITSRGRWTRFTNDRGRGGNIEQGEGKEWSRVGQVWSRVSWGKVTKYILQRWCHPSTLPSSSPSLRFLSLPLFLATRVSVLKTICCSRKWSIVHHRSNKIISIFLIVGLIYKKGYVKVCNNLYSVII